MICLFVRENSVEEADEGYRQRAHDLDLRNATPWADAREADLDEAFEPVGAGEVDPSLLFLCHMRRNAVQRMHVRVKERE
jgi:hypothetical protein